MLLLTFVPSLAVPSLLSLLTLLVLCGLLSLLLAGTLVSATSGCSLLVLVLLRLSWVLTVWLLLPGMRFLSKRLGVLVGSGSSTFPSCFFRPVLCRAVTSALGVRHVWFGSWVLWLSPSLFQLCFRCSVRHFFCRLSAVLVFLRGGLLPVRP